MYRYSGRLDWTIPATAFSQLLASLRASRKPLFDLTISNPTRALPRYPHAAIAQALGAIEDLGYQPEPFGLLPARAAIANKMHQRVPGIDLSPAHIALTASTSEAYGVLFKLLANPGDEILVPTPSYPLFDYLALLDAVKLTPYKLSYDGCWHIDFPSLETALSARTRAIILVNPNNPTGSFLKAHEFARLCDFALRHQLPLISDEVFMDYPFAPSAARIPTFTGHHNVLSFVLNGLSKSAGMPQLKLAWFTVNGPLAVREEACARLELVLDTYLSVGTPVQLAAPTLLNLGDEIAQDIRRRTGNNLATLQTSFQNQPVYPLHGEGGWSAILRAPAILSEEEWVTRLLVDHSVVVQPGYLFDLSGGPFLVVSLLTGENTFGIGVAAIKTMTSQL